MKNKIRQFLRKHPRLQYIQKCISGCGNDDFVKLMCGDHASIMLLESLGNKNSDHVIYEIMVNTSADGFFAIFRATLNYLYFADLMHFTPVVKWGGDIPYAEKSIPGNNPFLYYFKQVSDLPENPESSKYVVKSLWGHQYFAERLKDTMAGYAYSEQYLLEMGQIIKKYVQFNDEVQSRLDHDYNNINLSEKTLAIHVRGTDYNKSYRDHPIVVPYEEYFLLVDPLFEKKAIDGIFLATDDSVVLQSFKEKYGERVKCYQDVIRGTEAVSVAFSHSCRENHHFLLGYEVLRDAYTMSKCHGFIGNRSQVSICTQIFRNSSDIPFFYLKIMDRGLHSHGSQFKKPD